jgi:3-hydroxyacyl-[acyl-carrier-protein] dehydratase
MLIRLDMSQVINAPELLALLPHRYPFLLVDRVIDYQSFEYLKALKNVTYNEPYFMGHFPQKPVMPGVLIVEALAQASVILSNLSRKPPEGYQFLYYFAGIDNVRFKQVVEPGDTLILNVKKEAAKKDFWKMSAEATVNGTVVCEAVLLSFSKEIPL